jgi:hypothetical protein
MLRTPPVLPLNEINSRYTDNNLFAHLWLDHTLVKNVAYDHADYEDLR